MVDLTPKEDSTSVPTPSAAQSWIRSRVQRVSPPHKPLPYLLVRLKARRLLLQILPTLTLTTGSRMRLAGERVWTRTSKTTSSKSRRRGPRKECANRLLLLSLTLISTNQSPIMSTRKRRRASTVWRTDLRRGKDMKTRNTQERHAGTAPRFHGNNWRCRGITSEWNKSVKPTKPPQSNTRSRPAKDHGGIRDSQLASLLWTETLGICKLVPGRQCWEKT